ncbi:homocysteine S-methyltransferase YbgG-like isoform X2 [Physella acuta]|nr:homocysteine S-methyltransferase YbgG-like isoform X2 [Physella acuta]
MNLMEKKVVLLDGGTGMALVQMGHSFINDDPLWSAIVVASHPEDLIKLHTDYFKAGADVVLSATYQASIEGYQKRLNISRQEAVDLLKKGIDLVKVARDAVQNMTGYRGAVAASVGPYGATLCDRSEYHGRYADSMTKEDLCKWHLPRLQALIDAEPDFLMVETIPVVKEAEAILDCLKQFPNMKACVTFQCKDDQMTAHGELITDAVSAVVQSSAVLGVGVNCVHPDYVLPLVQKISTLKLNIPIIVKPNGGLFKHDGRSKSKDNISDYAEEWLEAGARWIGGCCHIYPSDIALLKKTIETTFNSQEILTDPLNRI